MIWYRRGRHGRGRPHTDDHHGSRWRRGAAEPAFGAPSLAGATPRYGAAQAGRPPVSTAGAGLRSAASLARIRRIRAVRWIPLLLLGLGVVLASWVVLILLANRLPPGLAKDLASFLPACATALRRLRTDPRVPRSAKIAVAIAAVWVISPIDLIPEFLPVIGPLDDVVVVALALRFAARRVPRMAIEEAWPGERRLLDRLLGPATSPPTDQEPAPGGRLA